MTIASFDGPLRAATEQPEPRRPLFVSATAGVGVDADAAAAAEQWRASKRAMAPR